MLTHALDTHGLIWFDGLPPEAWSNRAGVGVRHHTRRGFVLPHALILTHTTTPPSLWLQIPLYQGAGFELVGPSDVVHGQDPWQEMALALQQQGGSGS